MNEYLVIIEETPTGFSAYSPDIDGCVAAAESREEVETLMNEALTYHLEMLAEEGLPIPKPHTYSRQMRVAA
ncbi:MAG: type II toxin-antitoxin system HicB family antitoxin [bacterium]